MSALNMKKKLNSTDQCRGKQIRIKNDICIIDISDISKEYINLPTLTSHHSSLERMWILGLIFMLLVSETLGGDILRQEYFLCLFHLTTCLTMYRTVFTPQTCTGGVKFNPKIFVLNAVLTRHLVSITRERGIKFSVQIRDLYCHVKEPTRLPSSLSF